MGCKQLIIAPVVTGGGAIGRILLGVALVALAFIPGIGTATAAAVAAGTAKAFHNALAACYLALARAWC
jgi:uncharacterized protein (DUF697 family)